MIKNPLNLRLFLVFTLVSLFWSCASQDPQSSYYREVHPEGFLKSNEEVYWSPLNSMSYDLVDSCSSLKAMANTPEGVVSSTGKMSVGAECLATSESNAVFDFNSALQKSLDSLFERPKEFMPGLWGIPESDSIIDSIHIALGQEVNRFFEDFNPPEPLSFCFENELSNNMHLLLSRLNAAYDIKYLITPLNVKAKVWANNGGTGTLIWEYTLAIWDLSKPSLLYVVHQKENFSPSGEQKVDKDVFKQARDKWIQDWSYLRTNLKEECSKESR